MTHAFPALSRYTFGSMSLGRSEDTLESDIAVAQLVSMSRGPGCLAEQLRKGGPIADGRATTR